MNYSLRQYPDYRNADLPWLASVPSGWDVQRAKSYFSRIDVRSREGAEELLTVSSADGIRKRSAKAVTMFQASSYAGHKLCWPGDLVVNSLWAWATGLGFSRYHGIVSTAYSVYRLRPELLEDFEYFHSLLRSRAYDWEFTVRSKGIWISRLQLTDQSFFEMPILLPPCEDRKAIILFLRHLDLRVNRLLKTKRRLIELLTEQKQAIIHRAVTRGLDPDVRLKASGIDEIQDVPEYSERRAVGQLFYIGRGEVTSHEYIAEHPGPYPLYSSQTSNEGIMGYIDSFMFDGDYLTWTTDGAHAGTVFYRTGKFNCTNVCGTLRPKTRMFLPFMRYAIGVETKPHVRIDINPKLMNNMMARIRVNTPPYDEQVAIYEYLKAELEKIHGIAAKAQSEIDFIREYRTRLVSDVVTGQLDVRGLDLPELDEAAESVSEESEELGEEPGEDGEGAEE